MEDYKIENHDGEYIGTSRDEIIDGLARFRLDEEQYNLFPDELWKDKEVIITSVRAGNYASHMFHYIDESLWRDKDFLSSFLYDAQRHSGHDDIEGHSIVDYIHPSIKNCIQIRPLLDSYLDQLDEDEDED